jgi:Ala-tRNA(Pro) deacylase
MTGKERLEAYLRERGVAFQSATHPQVFTAQEVAAVERVPGRRFAKVVMVKADERLVMLVLPAPARVDISRLGQVLGAKEVRLAPETEFAHVFPDCEVGAMPPFGHLYQVPVYVDRSLAAAGDIVFRAGTHRDTLQMAFDDYMRLAQPTPAEFTW